MGLTKSKFCSGIQCEKKLYLEVHQKSLASPVDAAKQLIFDQGHQVGLLARTYFSDGVLIEETHESLDIAIQRTQTLVSEGKVSAIFEATFSYEEVLVRVDILKNNLDGTWDLLEVKSTTEFKDQHLDDISIQLWVLEGCGLKIRKTFLRHLNNQCIHPNVENLFTDYDTTEDCREKIASIQPQVENLLNVIDCKSAPKKIIGPHCLKPYECDFREHCWKDVPKGSTLDLYNYKKKKPTKFELFHGKYRLISDLPENYPLTEFQRTQWLASKTTDPIVDKNGLRNFLSEVKYPLFYFDFETVSPAIPLYNGTRPYQKLPVQFSCHVLRSANAEIEHHDFIASGKTDPRNECLEALLNLFANFNGTVVAYNMSFEKNVILELGEHFPVHQTLLNRVCLSFWDLKDAFSRYFYHRDFQGSISIKYVLPYFFPDMDYAALAIKDGGQASAELMKLITGTVQGPQLNETRKNLREYCSQDSMAMLLIHRRLQEI